MSRLRTPLCFFLLALLAPSGCHQPSKLSDEAASLRPELTLHVEEGVSIELILVRPGTFWMGSPDDEPGRDPDERLHRVRISRPFYLGRCEVTQAQWQAVMGTTPSFFHGSDRLPVDSVDWDTCVEFCKKLSRRVGRPVRLPAEAQWEYACRAGTRSRYSFGDTITRHDANFDWTHGGAQPGDFEETTMPVGSFAANAWGFFDMHGNVREWCADWYGRSYPAAEIAVDPAGPAAGEIHVLRGGSWADYDHRCRSAYRGGYKPGDREECNGFRVCMDANAGR